MNTNTTEIVEITSDNESDYYLDKPIVKFLRRLIHGKSKKKTLLSNAQIMNILKNELDLKISGLHNLEKVIYLTVMKNCLQNWPEWYEFSKHVVTFEKLPDTVKKTVLKTSYESLKLYLTNIYKTAVPLTKAAVQEVLKDCNKNGLKYSNPNPNVILHICATKSQLHKLIFRHPHPNLGDTIFNINPVTTPKIKISTLSMQSILNWCGVSLYILSPIAQPNLYLYKKEVKHEYKHVLVNKNLPVQQISPQILSQELQVKDGKGTTTKSVEFLEAIKKLGNIYSPFIDNVNEIFSSVCIEMLMLPSDIFPMRNYRRYMNKYPYIRYLYENVDNVSSHVSRLYDLQLEETITPSYEFYLGNTDFDSTDENVDKTKFDNAVVIECTSCQISISGKNVVGEVKAHFEMYHSNEIDYKCTNCAEEFTVETLTNRWWCHDCLYNIK